LSGRIRRFSDRDIWLLTLGAFLGALFGKFLDWLVSVANSTVVRTSTEPELWYQARSLAWVLLIFFVGGLMFVAFVFVPVLRRMGL
jgi:hypothetical protein